MKARLYGGRAAGRRFGGPGRYRPIDFGSKHAPGEPGAHRGRSFTIGVLLVLGAVAVAAGVVAVAKPGSVSSLVGSSNGSGSGAPATPSKPLTRTRVRALPHPHVANGTEPLYVTLSGKPAAGTARPRFSPAVAGAWTDSGNREVFKATATLQPCASYRLTVPRSTTAEGHSEVGKTRTEMLQVACPPVRGMQVALAHLGYLPDSFHTSDAAAVRGQMTASKAAHLIFHPPAGTLEANLASAPSVSYGTFDNVTKGALMVFQEDHKLEPDGTPGPKTWTKLLTALTRKFRNPSPYTFVTVTETLPETLEVHKGDKVVLSTPANTGVPGAETEQGAFPIFERFTSTTMVGTNPDGSKYNDPGVPWVNYFNGGDAVHGFIRPGYGYPQSNGCVELPIETAHTVFDMLRLGDIVVVS